MSKNKSGYKRREGTYFLVPLIDNGFVVGILSHINPISKTCMGYFFGPRHQSPPSTEELKKLRPSDAIHITWFSGVGLEDGLWPILQTPPGWSREAWPMPIFGREDTITGAGTKVVYLDNGRTLESPCSEEESRSYPQDVMDGHEALRASLTILINGGRLRRGRSPTPAEAEEWRKELVNYLPADYLKAQDAEIRAMSFSAKQFVPSEMDGYWLLDGPAFTLFKNKKSLAVENGYDVEEMLRRVLTAENKALLERIELDSEAMSFVARGSKEDLEAVANVIKDLARNKVRSESLIREIRDQAPNQSVH